VAFVKPIPVVGTAEYRGYRDIETEGGLRRYFEARPSTMQAGVEERLTKPRSASAVGHKSAVKRRLFVARSGFAGCSKIRLPFVHQAFTKSSRIAGDDSRFWRRLWETARLSNDKGYRRAVLNNRCYRYNDAIA
jgi:hypothetical protein